MLYIKVIFLYIIYNKKKDSAMYYGSLHLCINEILKKGICKNKICKCLDIPRTNFNKYCRDGVSRFNTGLICKLCWYLCVDVGKLLCSTAVLKSKWYL